MAKQNEISIQLNPKIAKELASVAEQVGFRTPEELLSVYIREVIIAARIEQATMSLRETIARGSTDLDELMVERAAQK